MPPAITKLFDWHSVFVLNEANTVVYAYVRGLETADKAPKKPPLSALGSIGWSFHQCRTCPVFDGAIQSDCG